MEPIRIEDKKYVVTKKFYKKAQYFGTKEYYMLAEAKEKEPEFAIEVRKINKNPEKNTYKNLTYNNMESYIKDLNDSSAYIAYENARKRSKIQKSPYKWMVKWFTINFADYTECDLFRKDTIANTEFADMTTSNTIAAAPLPN